MSLRPEFALYSALKLSIYSRLSRLHPSVLQAALTRMDEGMTEFSVRQIHKIMSSPLRTSIDYRRQFTDFFDISSYYVRERVKNLNHGTVLTRGGHGLRNAAMYRWGEPPDPHTLQSFRAVSVVLRGNLNFSLDLYRISETFGLATFDADAYIHLFRTHRESFLIRRRYKISSRASSDSIQFTNFLLRRLADLCAAGLTERIQGGWRLTSKGVEAVHWFELFAFSVAYGTQPGPAGAPHPAGGPT